MHSEYKNSGIEWIGEIPNHWNVTSIKKEFIVIPSNVDKKIEDEELEVKLCNYLDVYNNDFITSSIDFMIASANENEIKRYQLYKGDVIITKDSEDPFDIAVPALVRESEKNLLCGYHLAIIRSVNNKIDGSFLFWVLKDEVIATQLWREACGITRWAISSKHIKNSTIPFPPKPEQIAIVNYLEKVCADIDNVIESKNKQLDNLNKQVKSIIYHTVTKGLNPNVELKESGIDWIGKIPKHWKEDRLKDVLVKIGSGITPRGGALEYLNKGIPLIRSQNIIDEQIIYDDMAYIDKEKHDEMENSKVYFGDVLLNITGASLGRCYYYTNSEEANVNQHVCILRPSMKVDTKYLHLLILSELGQIQINTSYTGSGREGLNFKSIKKFRFHFPPIEEQKMIVNHVEKIRSNFFSIKEIINNQIDTLFAYKKSLIHEVVTGKKQVYN